MVLLKCAVFDSKNSRLIKEQETKKLLSNLGLKTPLSKVSLVSDILFQRYKMKEKVNKFLLSGNYLMPKMHLVKHGFTYSANEPFTKSKEGMQKFKET